VPMADRGVVRTVAALAGLSVLAYMDRQLLVAVSPLLMAELGLSRARIGLLIGVAFIAVYATATLVVGVLADRWPRPRLIAGGLAAWSAGTALTATAGGFAPLAAWRALVGVGEATLSPSALSMLGDRVPARRLGLATGVFYAGVPVGWASSYALAGAVAPRLGWRACFLLLGLAGLVAVSLAGRMADPPRRGAGTSPAGVGLVAAVRAVAGRPVLAGLVAAATLVVYASASSQHTIIWLVEEHGFPYPRAAFLSAIVGLTAGLAGNVGIGVLTDRAQRRHPAGRLLALAGIGVVGLGAAAAFYWLPSGSVLFFPCWFVAQFWLLGWFGPHLAAIDDQAPAGMRATVLGIALLVLNLVGLSSGPYVTGLIGDRASLTSGLTWSLVPAALGVALVGLLGLAPSFRGAPSFAGDGESAVIADSPGGGTVTPSE
jgi:predicted MFS family arabinose efflux permease